MEIAFNLKAGLKSRAGVGGRYLAVLDVGAAQGLEVAIYAGTNPLEHIKTVTRGLSLEAQDRFDTVEMLATVDCVVKVVVSDGLVRVGSVDGANVNATIMGQPVAVVPDRGAPANPIYAVGMTLSDAPATGAATLPAVAVGSGGAQVAAANANSRSLRFYNQGPDPVALGPAGTTWANRAKVLEAGDGFIEERGAPLAWWAVTDAGKTATIGVERVTA